MKKYKEKFLKEAFAVLVKPAGRVMYGMAGEEIVISYNGCTAMVFKTGEVPYNFDFMYKASTLPGLLNRLDTDEFLEDTGITKHKYVEFIGRETGFKLYINKVYLKDFNEKGLKFMANSSLSRVLVVDESNNHVGILMPVYIHT